jgi:hypothetical protein
MFFKRAHYDSLRLSDKCTDVGRSNRIMRRLYDCFFCWTVKPDHASFLRLPILLDGQTGPCVIFTIASSVFGVYNNETK